MVELSLSNLSPQVGSHHRKKIVGRGVGSGHGRHSTRGMKGQRSRRGDSKMIGFEGGQMTLLRRIPKRGFNCPFPLTHSIVNVGQLEKIFEPNTEITAELLFEKCKLKRSQPIKILGEGILNKPFKILVPNLSKKAKEKVLAAGGELKP